MKTTALALVVILALALIQFAGATPARATDGGFHAAFYTENVEFADAAIGDTKQFIVGFTNTGESPWLKGVSNQQANLGTAVPLDNRADYDAGWAKAWLAPNRYAAQDDAIILPRRVGYFTYNVVVPAGALHGKKYFYGRPLIEGVGPLEDYGYYQGVNVQGAVKITSVTPTGPTAYGTPTVAGSAAKPGEAVTISDGATGPTVGSGTADQDGKFNIATTRSLADGTHTLVPSTPSQGAGSGITYVVDSTLAPSLISATLNTGFDTITLQFSKVMLCASADNFNDIRRNANYFINLLPSGTLGPSVASSVPNSDCTSTVLTLSSALTASKQYSIRVEHAQDAGGRIITSDALTFTTTVDTTAPRVAWINATRSDGAIVVVFNEPMNTTNGSTGASSVLNLANYQLDGQVMPDGSAASCQSVGCTVVKIVLPSASALGTAGSSHTLRLQNVADVANNFVNPNPNANGFTAN